MVISTRKVLFIVLIMLFTQATAWTQQVDASLYQNMRWRMIGPFRGGRTVGATGVRSQPNVFLHRREQRRRLEDE